MLSDIPRSEYFARKRSTRSGFTLIELLMVIAVIGILVGMTFGISDAVRNAQGRSRAKAEIASIAMALEQFKSTYGDYPWTTEGASSPEDNSELLLQALLGCMKFEREGGVTTFVSKTNVPSTGPKALIDVSKLTIRKVGDDAPYVDLPSTTTSGPSGYYLADPWGNPYVFVYGKSGSSNTWEVFGFHLYSMGPDELQDTSAIDSTTGVMVPDFREIGNGENVDNIYTGE